MKHRFLALLLCYSFLSTFAFAQQDTVHFEKNANLKMSSKTAHAELAASYLGLKSPMLSLLTSKIKSSPKLYETSDIQDFEFYIALPNPDGKNMVFKMYNTPLLVGNLAREFPNFVTATGLDQYGNRLKLDITDAGIHAMIIQVHGPSIFINPFNKDQNLYTVFYKSAYPAPELPFHCGVENHPSDDPIHEHDRAGDCQFRQYRLALACTGEYAQFHGGTTSGAMAAMTTSINRCNGVYESEMGVTLVFVSNNSDLIYLNGSTDPFSNNNASNMLSENQTNTDNVIGSANYDIGHVFSTGGGGVAYLNSPCNSNIKAGGVTGSSNPQGDPFDIDYVAHEMGHQFGARHTQNNNCNRSIRSYEPGSGSTIMSYAGICSPNVQNNADAYYHAASIIEIGQFTTNNGNACATIINSTNTKPVALAGSNRNIPISTPFQLSGSGTDADNDSLSYNWEQYNNDISVQPPEATSTSGPNFRSRFAKPNGMRDLPEAGIANTWEVLPSVQRTMFFKLTVRDIGQIYGCTDDDNMNVTFNSNSGPFVVIYPNGGESFTSNSASTVTWDVANTTASPVSCSQVDIKLSTNGGQTYDYTIATGVTNNGSANITWPAVNSPNCLLRVYGSNNIFFDVSDGAFEIIDPSVTYSCTDLNSTDVPISITGANTYNSTMNVTLDETISSLEVINLTGTHDYLDDLVFTLSGPDGTSVILVSQECGSADDFNCGFSDAGVQLVCPYTTGASFIPQEALSAFAGKSTLGTWTLTVADVFPSDDGVLQSWGIKFCYADDNNCPQNLTLDMGTIQSGVYRAANQIDVSIPSDSNADILLQAGNEMNLYSNFDVPLGTILEAKMAACP